jgi:hypothetical protein
MFQSGQLTAYQTNTLASLVILLVTVSLGYFAWVVFGELWVAFYPETPIAWLGIKPADDLDLFESKLPRDSHHSAITFENQNPMALPTDEDEAMDYGDSAIVVQDEGDDEGTGADDEGQRGGVQLHQQARVKKEMKSGSISRMLSLPQMLGGKQPKLKRGYSDLEVEGQDPDEEH